LKQAHPHEDSYSLALAWAYHDCGKKEEAIACFQELFEKELQQEIFSGFAFDELVRIYKENGYVDLLLDICERAVQKTQGNDFSLLGDLGDAFLRTGRWSDAACIFERMITLEPNLSSSYCLLGNARVAMGEPQKAREAYLKAAEIEPERREAFSCRLANIYLQAGYATDAEETLRTCLKEAMSPLACLELADLLLGDGRFSEAENFLEQAIRLDHASRGVFYNRFGNRLARLGHHKMAVGYFQQAILTDPENFFYRQSMETSFRFLGSDT
jgi:tetratricopeptide (TPR) repeat protein